LNDLDNESDRYFICPHCGSDVDKKAIFCRECGASEDSGWNTDDSLGSSDSYDGYGDEDFDYDEFLRREFPTQAPQNTAQGWRHWTAVAIILITCASFFLWMFVG